MYAIATIPLIKKLHCAVDDVNQVWFADDASMAGKIPRLRQWWNLLSSQGPKFGYFANATKTWLVTKGKFLTAASSTMSCLCCRLTFSLLLSAIQCIRGAHSSCGHATKSQTPPIDLVNSEINF